VSPVVDELLLIVILQDVTDYWDFAPDFSKHYVDTFIEECLDDVIIPDLLIEVLSDEDQMVVVEIVT